MECNKDEAVRAKDIAEKRMQESDFAGALKITWKAQKLFPEIENISQMLTVRADEATIKKQYRKLALLLHPDKNKFAGAEGAFKLTGEANRMLSDQTKRSLYDIKCRALMRRTTPEPPPHQSNGVSVNLYNGNVPNFQNNPHSQSTA
ncbi:DnaJ domain containing protein [Quillaja saponaria]|uniref:DnaJ domain containing protein n=1 Tax=Quillaja saponaria TaxID=32244 RepID=A0AAD7VJQ3_QUISA|nr:DnaJ domain containing protein [Quillaja saponaria]KAJ7978040.1 DnaJ domain containing protein [Quillaja saponaria]